MVRTYWFLPIFYEAIGTLDLQPSARTDRVEACRPLGWCSNQCTAPGDPPPGGALASRALTASR